MDREVIVLRDFETFLSQLGTVSENKTKFPIHWVRIFLKSRNYEAPGVQRGASRQ